MKKSTRIITDLREIKLLIETFEERTSFVNQYEKLKNIKFDYFHTEKDIYEEIKPSDAIVNDDERFLYKDRPFCQYSPFWCGCIRISQSEFGQSS